MTKEILFAGRANGLPHLVDVENASLLSIRNMSNQNQPTSTTDDAASRRVCCRHDVHHFMVSPRRRNHFQREAPPSSQTTSSNKMPSPGLFTRQRRAEYRVGENRVGSRLRCQVRRRTSMFQQHAPEYVSSPRDATLLIC